jgi:hypothetical protein
MSISFGGCESEAGKSGVDFWDSLFEQAASEGISVFVSSGDSGASGCDANFATPPASPEPNSPNAICSSSYATCVGGTEFNDTANPSLYWSSTNSQILGSALGYIPEGGWNEPLNSNSEPIVAASGGGVSAFIPTPSWQTGTGVPAARTGRYTPDVAFSAANHDGYFGCLAASGATCVPSSSGEYEFAVFSGTSAAAPSMAGIAAILDQGAGTGQGNLNPAIYQMAGSTPAAFHDVTVSTSGVADCAVTTPSMCNNSIPSPTALIGGQAGFLVDTGYDEVTGLGSLDVATFVTEYQGTLPPTIKLPDISVPISFGSLLIGFSETTQFSVQNSGSQTMNPVTVTLTGTNAGDYSQTNTCNMTIPSSSACMVQLTFTPTGTGTRSATLTLASSNAVNSPKTVSLVGTGSTTPFVPLITAVAYSQFITPYQSTTVQASVFAARGPYPTPTGSVTVTCGNYTSAAVALSEGNANIVVPGASLSTGTDILTVTYTPDAASSPVYAQNSITAVVYVGTIAPTVTETLSSYNITPSTALTDTVSVAGGSGNPTPTGSVVVSGGGYTSLATTLAGGSATITIPAGSLSIGSDVLTAAYTPDATGALTYTATSITTPVTVANPVPASFAVTGSSVTIEPGATTGNYSTITITPSGGFTGSVTLSASVTSSPLGAQDLPTLSFGTTSPVTITGTAAGTATLVVTTTAPTSAALAHPDHDGAPWLAAGGTLLAGLLFFCIPARRRDGWMMLGTVALWLTLTGGAVACGSGGGGGGGGNPGTTPGAYNMLVTGVSGSETQTFNVEINVQ